MEQVETAATSFQELVRKLSNVLEPSSGLDSDEVDPAVIQQMMRIYTSDESEWAQYAFVDSSRPYTRNLVDEGNGKSNLLILVWTPGKGSPIHDHANAHCVMKVLKGSLKEVIYEAPQEDLPLNRDERRETIYVENQVTYMSDKIGVHRVSNASESDIAVSLHLYTPPFASKFGFKMFCEKTGKSTYINQTGFFSDRGARLDVAVAENPRL